MPETSTKQRTYFYGTGRRKRSIARVRLYEKGKGEFVINEKPIENYLTTKETQMIATQALTHVSKQKDFDISVKVDGGGTKSQSEAIRLGTARALVLFDDQLRSALKPKGYLKRDPRKKERKKPGLKKARRAPQFSKR